MKQKKWLLALLAVLTIAFALTGCFLGPDDSIEMVNAPKVDYTLGEDENALSFTVKVVYDGETYVLDYPASKDVLLVENFSLTTTGTRTATVKYTPATNLEITFTYTVNPETSEGLIGKGTEAEPYQLSSAEDFQLFAEGYGDTYAATAVFALTQDIDFSDFDVQTYAKTLVEYNLNFVGTFDGNGYTISNLTVPGLDGSEDGEQTQTGLFYRIAPASGKTIIRNVKFVDCSITNSSAAGAGILGHGGYKDATAKGTVEIDNVDMYGCSVQAMKNSSLYLGYAAGKNLIFKNCDIDANSSVMTTSHSAASFIGSGNYIDYDADASQRNGSVVFDNCVSAAKLTGASIVHGFLGNYSSANTASPAYTAERKNGSKYVGTIYTMAAASDSDSILPNVANTSLDNYKIYCAGSAVSGTGFTAEQSIQEIKNFKYIAGEKLSSDKVANGVSYVFAYSFARGGSTYGNSETIKNVVGNTVTSENINYFTAIYDYLNENYSEEQRTDADGLCIYGALSKLTETTYKPYYFENDQENAVYRAAVTFSVMVFDSNGNLVAYGKDVKETKNVSGKSYIDSSTDNGIVVTWNVN